MTDKIDDLQVENPATLNEKAGVFVSNDDDDIELQMDDLMNIQKDSKIWLQVSKDSKVATEVEHELKSLEAFKIYRWAVFWSVIVSMGIIMDGYDRSTSTSLYSLPVFQERFGIPVKGTPGKFQLEAVWQLRLGICQSLGNIIGIFINGMLTEWIGHKRVMLVMYVFISGFIFLQFFASTIQQLMVAQLFTGMPIGIFSVMAVSYASEICPTVLRGYLEVFVLLCWGTGQLLASGVSRGFSESHSQWGWRVPYAVQWTWPVICFFIMLFAPDSPWWLVRKQKFKEAEKIMNRLITDKERVDPKKVVAMMLRTTELEREVTAGVSYLELFKGYNLRRTEINCGLWTIQALMGFIVTSYFTYFYEQAGLAPTKAFDMSVAQGCISWLCACCAFALNGRFFRRQILIPGMCVLTVFMFCIGFIALAKQNTATGWAESVFCLVWWCFFQLTVAPCTYILIGETASTRLRAKTVGLGRMLYNVYSMIASILTPIILNPTASDWKGKAAFLPAGFAVVLTIWAYFRVPECKHRTYEELDLMFEQKVPARKFRQYSVNAYADVE